MYGLLAIVSRNLLFVGALLSATVSYGQLLGQEGTPSTAQQLDHLLVLATSLTEEARSGNAAATQFRIDTVFYRETLRDLMLEQQSNAALPKNLLMEFVRMSALLQSAAECQTGRYIVCPPQLMQQLTQQQTRLAALLAAFQEQ